MVSITAWTSGPRVSRLTLLGSSRGAVGRIKALSYRDRRLVTAFRNDSERSLGAADGRVQTGFYGFSSDIVRNICGCPACERAHRLRVTSGRGYAVSREGFTGLEVRRQVTSHYLSRAGPMLVLLAYERGL